MDARPATRRSWLVAGVGAAAAVAGAGGAWWRYSAASDRAPLEPAFWNQQFDQPGGGSLSFAALKGKALLLNFWATWCPPCVEELPMIDRFFKQQAANGWQVVGLAIDQPSAVQKFLQRTPVSFPIGLAGLQGTELVRALGNNSGGLPFTLVVGADGAVLGRKMGKLTDDDLAAWLRSA
ncbi:MAG: TlpA family protein disulfide reductase [Comamonadaceae bacterium]|nr:MAG: TlpA family protein disulfide reductase [Comamonadaceae bacterium]